MTIYQQSVTKSQKNFDKYFDKNRINPIFQFTFTKLDSFHGFQYYHFQPNSIAQISKFDSVLNPRH